MGAFMKTFSKFIGLLAGCLASFSLVAWVGEEITLSKGNNSVSFMIRYYNGKGPDAYTQLRHEGFHPIGSHYGVLEEEDILNVCGALHHFFPPKQNEIYTNFKNLMNANKATDFKELLELHNRWWMCAIRKPIKIDKAFKKSRLIIFIENNNKDMSACDRLFNFYKTAMKKIAQEDAAVSYKETHYRDGQPLDEYGQIIPREQKTNLWTKFKNFVVNEKFLYAMAGLSALYFGYEYLNQ